MIRTSDHRKRFTIVFLATTIAVVTLAPAAPFAQCVAPSLAVAPTVCRAGDLCEVSIDLDSDGGSFAAAAATLSSSGAISCESCEPGAAAGGICIVNQATCAWNVSDFSLQPFDDGEVVVLAITCDELGVHSLDLAGVSLGRTDGRPQDGCAVGATLECGNCIEDSECDDGNACTTSDVCTGGVCMRDDFCGVPVSRGAEPVASDALFTLRAAIGNASCPLCECDVDASGSITATDALTVLQRSVGLGVALVCFAPEL